jgi:hypothetical protein
MSDLRKFTDQGLSDGLAAIAQARGPIQVRLRDAERRADLAQQEATSLRHAMSVADTLRDLLRGEQARRAEEQEART